MKKSRPIMCILLCLTLICSSLPLSAVAVSSSSLEIPNDAVLFNGHYYKVIEKLMVWSDAKAYCEELGGHLVTITSKEENDIVLDLISYRNHIFMTGLSDIEKEGTWSWTTGETVSFVNWGGSQPDNSNEQDVVGICSFDTDYGCDKGTWDDISAQQTHCFVCEWDYGDTQNSSINIGDCITLGRYNGKPIVWRCVDIDENGPLMLSEDVLCEKEFDAAGVDVTYHTDGWSNSIRSKYGSNCWYDSNIRQWLNSDELSVSWTHCPPSYSKEAGFLTGFTAAELLMVKSVIQKTYVNSWEKQRKGYVDGGTDECNFDGSLFSAHTDHTKCWYQNVEDKFFLLNQVQISNIHNNNSDYLVSEKLCFTRIAINTGASYENIKLMGYNNELSGSKAYSVYGIRPAFYLNEISDLGSLPKDYCQYSIKVIDSLTKKPVPYAKLGIYDGDDIYTADESGLITIDIDIVSDIINKQIVVASTEGYEPYYCYIYNLSLYKQNIIELKSQSLTLDFAKLSYGELTVDGPTIDFMGQKIPLFSVDLGLDLSKIFDSYDMKYLEKANNIKHNKATKTISIMLGVGDGYSVDADSDWYEDYHDFKDYYKSYYNNASWQQVADKYNAIREKLNKVDTTLGVSCSVTACGYLELDYSSGSLKLKEGGIVLTAESSIDQTIPFGTWFYATFKLTGSVDGKMNFQIDDSGTFVPSLDILFKVMPSIGVGAKCLSKNIASVEIGIDGKIECDISVPGESLEDILKCTLTANAYLKYNILHFQSKISTKWDGVQLYPQTPQAYDMALLKFAKESNENHSSLTSIPRDYLESRVYRLRSFDISLNEQSIYPYSVVELVTLDNGTVVAFWIKDDGSKSDNNRTTLYYSIFSNDTWSTPTPVYESGRSDFSPKVATDGTNIYLLWQRASKVFNDECELTEMLENTELVYSKYAEGEFTEPIVVSNGTNNYELSYSIATEKESLIVSWIENSENDYTQYTGINTVMSRVYSDNQWNEVKVVSSGEGRIGSLSSGFYNNLPLSIYTREMSDTNYSVFFNDQQITVDETDNGAVSWQNGKIYWAIDGILHYYENDKVVSTGLEISDSDYIVCSAGTNNSVIFRYDDGFKNELYISYETNNGYTTPVKLTTYDKHISNYDVVALDGKLISLIIADNLNNVEGEFPYTTTDMICDIYERNIDLSIGEYISYDETALSEGMIEFTIPVKNKGTVVIDNYSIIITNSGGNILLKKDFHNVINPGDIYENVIEYTVPADFSCQELFFTIDIQNDINAEDNIKATEIGQADIEITSCIIENGYIIGEVHNKGYDVAEDIIVQIDTMVDERITIGFLELGNLKVVDSLSFKFKLPDEYVEYSSFHDDKRFIVIASTSSSECDYINNEYNILQSPISVDGISLDRTNVNLCIGKEIHLKENVTPFDAFDKNVVWISDATDVAVVDQFGKVGAVSEGVATITVLTRDGDYVANCIINVADHNWDKGTIVKQPDNEDLADYITYCVDCGENKVLSNISILKFSGASLTLQNNLTLNYKVPASLFTYDEYNDESDLDNSNEYVDGDIDFVDTPSSGKPEKPSTEEDSSEGDEATRMLYSNPYVVFTLNGVETKVTEYIHKGDQYIFDFEDIIPHQMNDVIYATLYATYEGNEFSSETREYSVATYCYNTLDKYNTDEDAELRTLIVDLLNYGAASQVYMDYKINDLVNKNLTEEQKAWGTSSERPYVNSQNLTYRTMDNPSVHWKGVGLNLQDSVTLRFKIETDNIENLWVEVESEDRLTSWAIPSEKFELTEGGYYVFFDGFDASQMSDTMFLTVYDGNDMVSNIIYYSIESYVYAQQNNPDTKLVELLKAMMKYGDSAKNYKFKMLGLL